MEEVIYVPFKYDLENFAELFLLCSEAKVALMQVIEEKKPVSTLKFTGRMTVANHIHLRSPIKN